MTAMPQPRLAPQPNSRPVLPGGVTLTVFGPGQTSPRGLSAVTAKRQICEGYAYG